MLQGGAAQPRQERDAVGGADGGGDQRVPAGGGRDDGRGIHGIREAGARAGAAPGQVVLLDKLSAHKRSRVEALVAEAGAPVVWLWRYSPRRRCSLQPDRAGVVEAEGALAAVGGADGGGAQCGDQPRVRSDYGDGCVRLDPARRLPPYIRMTTALDAGAEALAHVVAQTGHDRLGGGGGPSRTLESEQARPMGAAQSHLR